MSDIIFKCPQCESKLVIDEQGAGMVIDCPKCSLEVTIPQRSTSGPKTTLPVAPTLEPRKVRSQILTDLSRVRKQLEEEQNTALESRRQFEAKLEREAQKSEAERRHLEQLLDENIKQAQSMAIQADQLGAAQAEITGLRNKCDQLERFAAQEKETLQEELEASIRREQELHRTAQEACTRIEDEYLKKLEISGREKLALQEREDKASSERNHLLTALDEQRGELERDTGNLSQRIFDLETRLSEEQQERAMALWSAREERERLEQAVGQASAEIEQQKCSLQSEHTTARVEFQEELSQRD